MNKKIALATLAMIPMVANNVYASGQTGIVTTSSLNVRSGAGTNNSVLFTVKKNDKVYINETSNGWYKIKNSLGQQGWASSTYIKIQNESSSNNSNQSSNNTSSKKMKVNTDNLNARNGAGTSYRIIMKLKKGTVVELLSQSNGWAKIKYDGRLGYVSIKYLSENQSQESSGTNTTTKEVNTDSLNVRSGPNTSYSVVGKLKKGEKVKVISESNDWSKIDYKGNVSYTSSRYLSNVSSQPTDPTPTPKPQEKPEAIKENKIVNTSSLNVRSGPGTNYSKVGTLSKGEKVGIMSESNGWSKIDFKGKIAYTSTQYLSSENTQIPPTQPDTNPGTNPGGDSSTNIDGATINNKALNYTLEDHILAQLERSSMGANVIDSSKPRSSQVMTTFMMREARGFIPADRSDLEYFLNPDNFKNSSKGIMQFLRLDTYKGGISASELNSYLNTLSPASSGTNVFYNQGQAFINAAQKYNIDLVYLVSHAMWETGYGKSTLSQGQTITSYKGQPLSNPVTVYNFFGIGAIDKSANVSGAEAAYSNGWTSIEATIDGSAAWIAQNYIRSSKYNQNTIYKMKFNYDYTWHQYATDVNWANGISGIMVKLIGMYDTSGNLIYEIPNYKK